MSINFGKISLHNYSQIFIVGRCITPQLLLTESRLCLLYRLSELASGNVVRGSGLLPAVRGDVSEADRGDGLLSCAPRQGLGQRPSGVQRQSLCKEKLPKEGSF